MIKNVMFRVTLLLLPLMTTAVAGASDFANIFDVAKRGTASELWEFFEDNADVDLKAKDNDGRTPLHLAAGHNPDVEAVEFLLNYNPDINAKSNLGMTPLHNAAKNNSNVMITQALLERRANVNAKDSAGQTPMDVADTDVKKAFLYGAGGVGRDFGHDDETSTWEETDTAEEI